eukprot:COSAG03_NODE_2727_length_2493_cov_9.059733_2_plen_163_part_00
MTSSQLSDQSMYSRGQVLTRDFLNTLRSLIVLCTREVRRSPKQRKLHGRPANQNCTLDIGKISDCLWPTAGTVPPTDALVKQLHAVMLMRLMTPSLLVAGLAGLCCGRQARGSRRRPPARSCCSSACGGVGAARGLRHNAPARSDSSGARARGENEKTEGLH